MSMTFKRFFSSFSLLLVMLFLSVSASATGADLATAAGIEAALSGLSISLGIADDVSGLITRDSLLNSIIGNPVNVPSYSFAESFVDIISDSSSAEPAPSTIKIRGNVVTIDGVEYSDVWLDHNAALKFRTNAFDFISNYEIASNSSGNFVSGVGYIAGVPMYNVNGVIRSSNYIISDGTSMGPYSYITMPNQSYPAYVESGATYPLGASFSFPFLSYFRHTTSNTVYRQRSNGTWAASTLGSPYVSEAFDFTWVSQTIPAEPFPSDYGLSVRLPSSFVSSLPSFITPDLSDYQSFVDTVASAFAQAYSNASAASATFEAYDSEPVPTAAPVDTNISDTPYSSLEGDLQGIEDSVDDVHGTLGGFVSSARSWWQTIDTNITSVANTVGQAIAGARDSVVGAVNSVVSALSGIASQIGSIASSIVNADRDWFSNIVDSIAAPFQPVFNIFRSGVGIWRYVVAWVGNVSGPFTWALSALGSAGSYMLSPFYAVAAAAVVIAIYKRFGR